MDHLQLCQPRHALNGNLVLVSKAPICLSKQLHMEQLVKSLDGCPTPTTLLALELSPSFHQTPSLM